MCFGQSVLVKVMGKVYSRNFVQESKVVLANTLFQIRVMSNGSQRRESQSSLIIQ